MASAPPPPPQFLLIPKPDPDAPPTPIPTAALTPELCNILRRELEPSADDGPDFAQQLRLYQNHLAALSANLALHAATLPTPPPPPPPAPNATPRRGDADGHGSRDSASSSATKKRARAGEMVRVTNLATEDHIHFRSLVRRARLTFEALLGIYHREEPSDGARNRFDLRASSRMLERNLWLYRDVRIVGPIPGVLVGDAFYYRAELCVVGLHLAPQAGICYIPASLVSEGHPVATSIVSSGGYLDDEDSGDVLIYTGSGGRQRNRVEHHADQTLERGNLALHYSYQYGVEVRVIRGHACESSPNRKVYVYDGLYRVVSSTYGPGKSGRDICKFKLMRLPGQDELGSKSWHSAKELKDTLDSKIRPHRYITLDLSRGKELFRIPVCNKMDEERSPMHFEYIAHPQFPVSPVPGPVKRNKGCHCGTACGSRCSCVKKNRAGPVYNEDGTLVRGRPVVYECGALCGCPMTCLNRVTQRGMKHRLEVFRSRDTEWGVRTLDLIQPGAFVCEYSGDVASVDSQSRNVSMKEGSFIDPKRFPERWKEWGDASDALPEDKAPQFSQFQGPGYVMDVSRRRNFACYISHSSAPNLFVQFVIHGNEDESFPHLMVFAMDTIPPMRELSIDYGMRQETHEGDQ